MHIVALQKHFFRRILRVLARGAKTNGETSMHLLISSLKSFLGRRYFGLKFISSLQPSLARSVYSVWLVFFFESPTIYFPRSPKQCFAFLQENFLKRTVSSRSQSSATPNHGTTHEVFFALGVYPTITPTIHFLRHGESSYSYQL